MDHLINQNQTAADHFDSDRRGFLKYGLLFTAALGFWTPALAKAAAPTAALRPRTLRLVNIHTGEKFNDTYWADGRYLPESFRVIKSVLRDYRANKQFPMDPRLMDILFVLQHRIGNFNAYEVFSGYRSPETNAMLRRRSEGVARNSLHMTGQAVDLHLPGTGLSALHRAAIRLQAGGVGFYRRSDFVHIDTGRVRHWG